MNSSNHYIDKTQFKCNGLFVMVCWAFQPLYCPDNTTDVRKRPIHCTTHSPFKEFVRDMHSENVQKRRVNIEEMYAFFT